MSNQETSDTRRKVVAQDAPVMRSVMLQDLSSSAGPSLGASPIGSSRMKIPKPRTFQQQVEKDDTIRISNERIWKVSPQNVPRLSPLYPLETAHVHISNASVQTISSRVAECLKNQSIHVNYQESCAVGESSRFCKFAVQLFEDYKDANTIVVEVQRREGCCVEFHKSAKVILDAASADDSSTKKPRLPRGRSFKVPCSVKQEYAAAAKQEQDSCQLEALELGLELLEKDRIDAQLLGMESLACLSKCNGLFLCESIQSNTKLSNALVSLIVHKRLPTSDNDEQQDEDYESDFEQEYRCKMHRCALTVLSNAWTAVACQDSASGSCSLCSNSELLDALIQVLGDASQFPHEACLAAQCLESVLKTSSSKTVMAYLDEKDLHHYYHSAMEVALQEGTQRHAELKSCALQLMEVVKNT